MKYFYANNTIYQEGGRYPVPEGALEIPGDHWLLADTGIPKGKEIQQIAGMLPVLVEIDKPTVESVATQKLQTINTQADALLQPITTQYPNTEILSWDKQEIEARRWQDWNDSDQTTPEPPTSYIDNILITRNDVDKPELIRRIIAKADAYAHTGQITGIRHNLEKQLEDIVNDDTLTDDEKRAAMEAMNIEQAYSVVKL
ncbi:hypothetical protein [Endozoicomonas ascidiicola]|uniref:hypothetical protein n=1 Tax=Endozoicomonas ascidiicola TaxID=1698521 RepID=UPI000832CB20|nr:hypothetical protein [Endozoicomonas ascidiicola]